MTTTLRTWSGLISALLAGSDLSSADTGWAMDQVVLGIASPAQIAGFLIALRAKGGDRTGVVNVSTMAAVVAASTGVTVVKYGGRVCGRPHWPSCVVVTLPSTPACCAVWSTVSPGR